ncbi:feruloyl esterase-like protein [Punctularia strigosozonata HHB-11173 SS5]|uniref:feruloyl esterase-like protein n=1 Tax=Punctularia strigosozonata (strain HHB-11173) TaxID=741275 RepID=UPI0004417293|nr:feruloyl esterase-like protein [Punctularia strigosozonata HHB-11173 SS5]EIN07982.1 feruloyl esterase-like protein [Punctularia strigosozonata HHB-11173 SS5]
MSTDTGHNSTVFDGSWHEPNQIVDWAFRAMHLSVIAGKQVVEAYYGKQEDMKSYYLGCSTGEALPLRTDLKEIQRFPEDFDGIVIGSPANWMSHLQSFSIHINLNVLPVNGSHWIPPALWKGPIHDEVLRQCDMIDGVADGIINNPLACNFRPETLSCRPGQDPSACLTLDQIVALRKIYSAYIETNQTFIFNGYYPGGELGFPNGLVGENILTIAPEYFQLWVLNDTSFSPFDLTLADIELADKIDPGTQNAIDPNITAFVSAPHNGKVLHYVGWADQLISPGNSLHYYDTVQAFMQTETDASVDDFYRLFTVAGMQHCSGGFGANAFGGSGQAAAGMPPLSNDPQHNILSAMVAWVENGTAPDNFTAVWYEDNDATQGVGFSRPLCKFPANLRFDGGNSNASSSFTCV